MYVVVILVLLVFLCWWWRKGAKQRDPRDQTGRYLDLLRGLELFFLIILSITLSLGPDSIEQNIQILYLRFGLGIALGGAAPIELSTTIIGYVLSLCGTLLPLGSGNRALRIASCTLSSLAIAGHINEWTRLVFGHPVQILLEFPVVLVAIDLLLLKQTFKGNPAPGSKKSVPSSEGTG